MISKHIIFYTRHVDNILIIYDHSKITSKQILDYVNTIYNSVQLKTILGTNCLPRWHSG